MEIAKFFAQRQVFQKSSFFIVTQTQTKGRGRFGRSWSQPTFEIQNNTFKKSEKNSIKRLNSLEDVYEIENQKDFLPLTFALAKHELLAPLEWVPLLTGVAVYESCLEIYKYISKKKSNIQCIQKNEWDLFLKWPNDLIWNQNGKIEKLAGILCETQVNGSYISHVYIGIGMNFFSHPEHLSVAGSFLNKIIKNLNQIELNQNTRTLILKKMSGLLEFHLKKYLCVEYNLTQIRRFVLKCSMPIGTVISINQNKNTGRFCGLNDYGALLFSPIHEHDQKNNKVSEIQTIYSADDLNITKDLKNIVCIDFGNTRIHITAKNFKNQTCHCHVRYGDLDSSKFADLFKECLELFDSICIEKIEIFYVSVNSNAMTNQSLKKVKKVFTTKLSKKKILTRHVTEKDIINYFFSAKTINYEKLGADRALKSVFAYQESQKRQKNVLIFSFGTATTCEGFSKEGRMIENFVFPGMQMSFNALEHFTALLPNIIASDIKFTKNPKFWSQETYMKRGVLLSVASTIFAMAKLHTECDIFLTGGNVDEIKNAILQISENEFFTLPNIEIVQNIETSILGEFALGNA